MNAVRIRGDYRQKLQIGHWVIEKKSGPFDVTKTLSGVTESQTVGPLTITESIRNGQASIGISALGFGRSLALADLSKGPAPFRFELDSGNLVEGTVAAA